MKQHSENRLQARNNRQNFLKKDRSDGCVPQKLI